MIMSGPPSVQSSKQPPADWNGVQIPRVPVLMVSVASCLNFMMMLLLRERQHNVTFLGVGKEKDSNCLMGTEF